MQPSALSHRPRPYRLYAAFGTVNHPRHYKLYAAFVIAFGFQSKMMLSVG
jgi:hypothetical protein